MFGESLGCVKAGEPLYPSTNTVPLAQFVNGWGPQSFWRYQITVDPDAHIVVVHNPSGRGVGSAALSTVTFPLVHC
jgi:hypothetical protein